MARLITAYAIYNAATNTYLGDAPPLIPLNCELFSNYSPRFGWLKRKLGMGAGGGSIILYEPTFSATDPEIALPNTLRGVFVQFGSELVMIDAISVENVVAVCDACCDDDGNAVTPYYGSVVPGFIPDFVSPTAANYRIRRTDAGTPAAVDQFSIDYMEQAVLDPVHESWGYGVSIYVLNAFGTPTLIGTDTFA